MISKDEENFEICVASKVAGLNQIHLYDPITNIKKGTLSDQKEKGPMKKKRESLT